MSDVVYSSAIGNFSIGLGPMPVPSAFVEPVAASIHPDVARLYDQVQTDLPGVTMPIIEQALWNTVTEFCNRSNYLRATVYWQMAIGVSEVNFNPYSAYLVVAWVLRAHGLVNWSIRPPASLVDHQTPTSARTGWAQLALRPAYFDNMQLGYLPELFTTWWETMLDGVMFRLFRMPTRPWSNPQLTLYHGQRFRQGINRARDIAERLHSNQQSPARAFPYFAGGRRKN